MALLDRFPASIRHAILIAAGIVMTAVVQWASTDYMNWNLPPEIVAILGFAIPMAVNYLTPWMTRQYGVGSSVTDPLPVDPPADAMDVH